MLPEGPPPVLVFCVVREVVDAGIGEASPLPLPPRPKETAPVARAVTAAPAPAPLPEATAATMGVTNRISAGNANSATSISVKPVMD